MKFMSSYKDVQFKDGCSSEKNISYILNIITLTLTFATPVKEINYNLKSSKWTLSKKTESYDLNPKRPISWNRNLEDKKEGRDK